MGAYRNFGDFFSNSISFSIVLFLPLALIAQCTRSPSGTSSQANRLVSTSIVPTSTSHTSSSVTHSTTTSTSTSTSATETPPSMTVSVDTPTSLTFPTTSTSSNPSTTASSGATRSEPILHGIWGVLGMGLGIVMVV